ncbi:MAG TPA: AMP-binding protein, partial [Bacteroidia bacterium]|nr:AMP-binding protein [Bacteroidia bacterium]
MAITRVFDILTELQEKYNKSDILCAKENGKWRSYSTQEFSENTNFLSYGLYNLGIVKNDKIAIIANNRPEWNFTDYAIQQAGAISVPIYPTISETDLSFILNDAGVKYLFISSKELYTKLKPTIEKVSCVKDIYSFDHIEGCKHWTTLLEDGKKNQKKIEIENVKKSIQPHDLLTILYTSGTTGTPKGVMLSHNNLISNSLASQTLCPFKSEWKALSFLPLNH